MEDLPNLINYGRFMYDMVKEPALYGIGAGLVNALIVLVSERKDLEFKVMMLKGMQGLEFNGDLCEKTLRKL